MEQRRAQPRQYGRKNLNPSEIIPQWENIPVELTERDQWVNWRYETRDGKPTKVPINAQYPEHNARADHPDTWAPLDRVREVAEQRGLGAGFVFQEGGGIVGVDLDRCVVRAPSNGVVIEPWAREIIDRLDSYTEYSPSGTGV